MIVLKNFLFSITCIKPGVEEENTVLYRLRFFIYFKQMVRMIIAKFAPIYLKNSLYLECD